MKSRILKAGLWAGLLMVMSCVIPMASTVFPILEGFADQAYAAVIRGTVFNDTNKNGTLENGEVGISGVTVTRDGSISSITDGAGDYTFTNVTNGNHTLSVADPAGYSLSSNNNPSTFNVQGNTTVNFGYEPITTTTTLPGRCSSGIAANRSPVVLIAIPIAS